jgi:hypothetical protein
MENKYVLCPAQTTIEDGRLYPRSVSDLALDVGRMLARMHVEYKIGSLVLPLYITTIQASATYSLAHFFSS